MSRKKDDISPDVAGFFDDDVDWLDDESEELERPPGAEASGPDQAEASKKGASGEAAPAAPKGSAPTPRPSEVDTPILADPTPAWLPSVAASEQPTLTFSSVPTLPPRPAPKAPAPTPAPPQTPPASPAPSAPGPLTTRPALSQPRPRRPVVPRRPATWKPKPPEPEPTVPELGGTPPPPARVVTPQPARRVSYSPSPAAKDSGPSSPAGWGDPSLTDERPLPPPPAPEPTPQEQQAEAPTPSPTGSPLSVEPRLGAAGWREVLSTLVAEAELAEHPQERGALWFAAARVKWRYLKDPRGARDELEAAAAAGLQDPRLFEAQARLAREEERWDQVLAHLDARAQTLQGAARADVLMEAALHARHRLHDPGVATARARAALEEEPQSYAALSVLRDLLLESAGQAEERAEILGRLAQASEGYLAAEAWVDQGRVLEELQRPDEARQAYSQALEACPWHPEAFLALGNLLTEQGDHAALGELLQREATRGEAGDGQDQGWWWLGAASAYAAAGSRAEADHAYDRALASGYVFAERERQGSLLRAGDLAGLASSIMQEIDALEAVSAPDQPDGRPFLWFRVGWLCEHHLDDLPQALQAYQRGLAIAPTAEPLADAVIRVLKASQRDAEITPFLEARLVELPEGSGRQRVRLQLAERAEVEGDLERAAEGWRALLAEGEVGESGAAAVCAHLAAEGQIRTLSRAERWAEVAALHAEWAEQADDPDEAVAHLVRAANAGELRVPDPALALGWHQGVLERAPDHTDSLRALEALSARPTRDPALAAALRAAGEAASDPVHQAAYFYRASRVFARAGLADSALEAAERCVERVPGFRPVQSALFETVSMEAGVRSALYRRYAEHGEDAEAQAWSRFAAACMCPPEEVGADLRVVFESQPEHVGISAMLEVQCIAEEDWSQLAALYDAALTGEPTPEKARLSVRVADLYRSLERREDAVRVLSDLVVQDVDGRPLRAAARIAERLQAWEQADQLLAPLTGLEDRLERARLLAHRLRQPGPALALLRALLEDHPDELGVSIQVARVAFLAEDRGAMVQAQKRLAEAAKSPWMKAAYSAWVAGMLDADGQVEEALPFWTCALDARPDSGEALRGVARGRVAQGDTDGIAALYAHRTDWVALAEALEDAGDLRGAVDTLAKKSASADLGELLIEARLRMTLDDWQGAYDLLMQARDRLQSEGERQVFDGWRRWILAEKLADTDAAWTLYQQFYVEAPDDTGVIEALARISHARGDSVQAIQYLNDLAQAAQSPADSARIKRRIGEVYEDGGDLSEARQSYLDALDHQPTDREALDGLRRLAEREEDWQGLIAVLQREVGLADEARRLELLREIAEVTEARLGDPAVAIDAWRRVTEAAPEDIAAFERLLALTEASESWSQLVEAGEALAALRTGAERTRLLYRVGEVCHDHLHRDDAVRYFEEAITGDAPSLEAAARLEQLYRDRADWAGVLRSLSVQAEYLETVEGRVDAWERSAEVELQHRHDREAASTFYAKILALQPDHDGALRFLSMFLYEAERPDQALPLAERLEPRVEEGQNLDDFDTRMELATFFFYFGEMLRSAGDPERAMPRYARALQLNPTHLASLEAVAPLYIDSQRWKEAEGVLRQLLQLIGGWEDKAQVASIYVQLGRVERELGNRDNAYKRFSKALEISPNHVDALKGMALILEDQKDWNNLLNVYNDIIYYATVPQHVIDAYMTKGRILDENMQRADKAAQHYQRSLEFDPEQPLAYLRLAELSQREGDFQEAGALAKKGLALNAEPEIRALLTLFVAAAEQAAGQEEAARSAVTLVLTLDPTLAQALPTDPVEDLPVLAAFLRTRTTQ